VTRTAVVGAGPAGLAVAARMKDAGVPVVVLEGAAQVGASWRAHYDRLHLHTARTLSALPGASFPRRHGRWVPRDGVVAYLEDYAAHNALDIRFETTVLRLDRREGGWLLATSGEDVEADRVVIATGYNRRPFTPDWPGRDGYPGDLVHASAYRNAGPYRGRHVLVAGGGNTGAEIAVDLVEGGAAGVRLALRTPPQIFPRQALGIPSQAIGMCIPHLPRPVADRVLAILQRMFVGDLSRYGMPMPAARPYSDYLARDAIPILDVGLIGMLKRRRIEIVPAVESFDGEAVVLAGGSRLRPDAVIAATGYRRDLEPLVGHLGVLDARGRPLARGARTHPAAPGLFFIGFDNPFGGNLRALASEARAIARAGQGGGR
jgi:putative flavoprotein involved in K+ transport